MPIYRPINSLEYFIISYNGVKYVSEKELNKIPRLYNHPEELFTGIILKKENDTSMLYVQTYNSENTTYSLHLHEVRTIHAIRKVKTMEGVNILGRGIFYDIIDNKVLVFRRNSDLNSLMYAYSNIDNGILCYDIDTRKSYELSTGRFVINYIDDNYVYAHLTPRYSFSEIPWDDRLFYYTATEYKLSREYFFNILLNDKNLISEN